MNMFRTVAGLNCLPTYCVVEDRDNRIWQKQPGWVWATPGVAGSFPVDDVELPVRLLDDGL